MSASAKALAALAAGLLLSCGAGLAYGQVAKSIQVANNTTSVAICPAACTLVGYYAQANGATIAYIKLYNAAQGSVTCGSGTPRDRIMIPANATGGGVVAMPAGGVAYNTALTACITTGFADNDNTAPAASTYQISFYTK